MLCSILITVGRSPIEINFKDMSKKRMKFMINISKHHHVDPQWGTTFCLLDIGSGLQL